MKRHELERELRRLGWRFLRHGGSHDIWARGISTLAIPRHAEVHELTARRILRDAHEE